MALARWGSVAEPAELPEEQRDHPCWSGQRGECRGGREGGGRAPCSSEVLMGRGGERRDELAGSLPPGHSFFRGEIICML